MRTLITVVVGVLLTLCVSHDARAFCGFYVAKADTKLFNKASKVVIVRDGNRNVLTMANDYKGELKEFAIVIPVPTFIEREQIHVANAALIDHLDAYSAPRLVEYYYPNPCQQRYEMMAGSVPMPAGAPPQKARAKDLGVTIEAEYTVGEYDILILSAKESGGLTTWLNESGYRLPPGAEEVLGSYIKQNMRFFVAKVNLEEQSKLGFDFLRPLQVAYESPKFMLPLRLGTINADGEQELYVFVLTRTGRVETTNYRTIKLPEGMDLPLYIKDDFASFYRDMFSHQVVQADRRGVFLEYALDMAWCDPCAAEPLSNSELRELGVFWIDDAKPVQQRPGMVLPPGPAPQNVFITRLHLRYSKETFPEDLTFQETSDRQNFQARYVLRHPWTGSDECEAATKYRETLTERQRKEAEQLAAITGWDIAEIRQKMRLPAPSGQDHQQQSGEKWWNKIWNK